jgi:hypothetical protein
MGVDYCKKVIFAMAFARDGGGCGDNYTLAHSSCARSIY